MALKREFSWRTISEDGLVKFLPEKWGGRFNDTFDSIEDAENAMNEYFRRNDLIHEWSDCHNCFIVCSFSFIPMS
jgi:hypothetical protein